MANVPPLPGSGLPDRNRGPEILAVCGSLTAVAFVFVAMRFYVRVKMTKNTSWDDWFCLSAWVIGILLTSVSVSFVGLYREGSLLTPSLQIVQFVELMFIIPEVRLGAGRHAAYIDPPSNIVAGLRMNFVTQPMFIIAVTLIKISIGFYLLRLAISHTYSVIIKVNMAVVFALCVGYTCKCLLCCCDVSFILHKTKF